MAILFSVDVDIEQIYCNVLRTTLC